MFTLVENMDDAVDEAVNFLDRTELHVANAVEEYVPMMQLYPCLLKYYPKYRLSSRRDPIPELGYHIGYRSLAKCLVYNKTNGLGKESGWRRSEFINWSYFDIRSIEEFYAFIDKSYKNLILVEDDGFKDTLSDCTNDAKPFLYHLEAARRVDGNVVYHQAILTLDEAKNLVYYQKNKRFLASMNTTDASALINRVIKNDPTVRKKDVKAINFLLNELKAQHAEIPF